MKWFDGQLESTLQKYFCAPITLPVVPVKASVGLTGAPVLIEPSVTDRSLVGFGASAAGDGVETASRPGAAATVMGPNQQPNERRLDSGASGSEAGTLGVHLELPGGASELSTIQEVASTRAASSTLSTVQVNTV